MRPGSAPVLAVLLAALAPVLVVAIPSAALAAPRSLPFTATLGLEIGGLPPIRIAGAGMARVDGPGAALDALELPPGVFALAASLAVADPAAFPIAGVRAAVDSGAGRFEGAGLAGALAVRGTATLCLFRPCDAAPVANLAVPLTVGGTRGVGLGGPPIVATGLVDVTLQGAPWTLGPVTAGGLRRTGAVRGPGGGGAASAGQAGGSVSLVTPLAVLTSIGASPTLPALGVLELRFVPEPGSGALLGVGLAALAACAGRRRSVRSRPRD